MNFAELRAERERLFARVQALLDSAETDNRELSVDEQSEYDTAVARIKEIKAALATPSFSSRAGGYGDPGDQGHLNEQILPLGAEPATRITASFPGVRLQAFRNDRAGREAAHRVGHFFAATFLRHGPSMRWCQEHGVHVDVLAALSGGSNTSGGSLVPDEMSKAVIALMEKYGAFRQNADGLSMGSDSLIVPRRVGGLTAFYVGEGVEGTESDASWDNVEFNAKKLMCLSRMSSEISEDSIINLGDTLTREIGLAFSQKEDAVGFNGDGTSTYGGQVGVLVKALDAAHTKAKVAAASPHNTLAEIDADDLLALMAAIPIYAKTGAKWYCGPVALELVFNAIRIAGGGNSMDNLANAPAPTFLGYPIIATPVMADDAATDYNGKVMLAFGNLQMAATVATRRGVRVQMTDQRYWSEDQIGIKGTLRHSIVTHDLGSTTVKSPFAVLVGTT